MNSQVSVFDVWGPYHRNLAAVRVYLQGLAPWVEEEEQEDNEDNNHMNFGLRFFKALYAKNGQHVREIVERNEEYASAVLMSWPKSQLGSTEVILIQAAKLLWLKCVSPPSARRLQDQLTKLVHGLSTCEAAATKVVDFMRESLEVIGYFLLDDSSKVLYEGTGELLTKVNTWARKRFDEVEQCGLNGTHVKISYEYSVAPPVCLPSGCEYVFSNRVESICDLYTTMRANVAELLFRYILAVDEGLMMDGIDLKLGLDELLPILELSKVISDGLCQYKVKLQEDKMLKEERVRSVQLKFNPDCRTKQLAKNLDDNLLQLHDVMELIQTEEEPSNVADEATMKLLNDTVIKAKSLIALLETRRGPAAQLDKEEKQEVKVDLLSRTEDRHNELHEEARTDDVVTFGDVEKTRADELSEDKENSWDTLDDVLEACGGMEDFHPAEQIDPQVTYSKICFQSVMSELQDKLVDKKNEMNVRESVARQRRGYREEEEIGGDGDEREKENRRHNKKTNDVNEDGADYFEEKIHAPLRLPSVMDLSQAFRHLVVQEENFSSEPHEVQEDDY